jgi:hypothetical protein
MKSPAMFKLILFVFITVAFLGLRHVFHESMKIDMCLDSGGKYDKESESCITK